MKEYLMTLTGVSILCGVIEMLSAEGNLKKYVRLLCALCMLCAVASPLFQILSDGDFDPRSLWEDLGEREEEDYYEIYNQSLLKNETKYAENILKNMVLKEFSLSESSLELRLKIVSKNETYEAETVYVILRDEAVLVNPKKMTDFLNEQAKCECVLIYE